VRFVNKFTYYYWLLKLRFYFSSQTIFIGVSLTSLGYAVPTNS